MSFGGCFVLGIFLFILVLIPFAIMETFADKAEEECAKRREKYERYLQEKQKQREEHCYDR